MRQVVKVHAECSTSNDESTLTFYALVDDVGNLVRDKGPFYGEVCENGGKNGTWLFILEPPSETDKRGYLNWGDGNCHPRDEINIFDHPIKEGGCFSRWYPDRQKWVYHIKNLTPPPNA